MEGMVESRSEGGLVVLGCLLVFMAKLSFIFVFQTQEKVYIFPKMSQSSEVTTKIAREKRKTSSKEV